MRYQPLTSMSKYPVPRAPLDSAVLRSQPHWSAAAPIYVTFHEEGGSCHAIVNVEYIDPAPYEVQEAQGVFKSY